MPSCLPRLCRRFHKLHILEGRISWRKGIGLFVGQTLGMCFTNKAENKTSSSQLCMQNELEAESDGAEVRSVGCQ